MPCNSDYMNPTAREAQSKRTCHLLAYALGQKGLAVPDWVRSAAVNSYGNVERLDEAVQLLCELCKQMTKEEQDSIIYDARIRTSRDLANWWEEHQNADIARETVPCELCGESTRSKGTKRCDRCWELETRIRHNPDIAKKVIERLTIERHDLHS